MGSSIIPQALCLVPVTNGRFAPVKLGFSALISRHPSSFRLSTVAVTRSPHSFGKFCNPARGFSIRAESGSEGADADISVGKEEVSEESEVQETNAELSFSLETAVAVQSEEKPERKPRIKLGDIMGILNKKAIEASDSERKTPDIRVGDVVEIKLEVPENKRRLSVYKGIVMSKQNAGIHTTIRIRRIIAGIGVEIVFPIYSPNIKEIRVLSHRKVRRARLYYLRDKLPRLSTFK